LQGSDFLLVFVESYGAVTLDRPEFVAQLSASRQDLAAAIHETGRQIVSAYTISPTFGGSSWLAHLSLLSGLEIKDPDRYAQLMTQDRDNLSTPFKRRGYRTVAVMPGLWQHWPEGVFYRFDEIYDGWRLDYRGPEFGWWALPDQFTLARLDEVEVDRPGRRPLFVFYPTVNTHAPFSPTPPYQPDWSRMTTPTPYDAADLDRAFAREPDWLNLSPSYGGAVSYTLRTLAGYLRRHASREFTMMIVGDHQPPAAVSGEGEPWDVPVHVVTGSAVIADRLIGAGFAAGLTPVRPALGPMHQLGPLLLEALE
jgi:hypothetical protein